MVTTTDKKSSRWTNISAYSDVVGLESDIPAPPVRAPFVDATNSKDTAKRNDMPAWLLASLLSSPNLSDNATNKSNRDWERFLLQFGQVINRQQLEQQGELSQHDILNASPDDDTQNLQVGIYTGNEDGVPRYYAGEALTRARASTVYGNAGDDNWRMTNIGEIQRDMVSGIANAARVTGVPAALLGAMAGIESGFGRNQMSPTGAEGIFQQTDGYLRNWYIDQARTTLPALRELNDPQVNSMLAGGISMAEARRLAYNPAASSLITALAARDMANDLGVDLNDRGNWWMVYAEHNVGRGGLNAIRRGDRPAEWIQNANPLFFRGVANPAQRYADKIEQFAGRFENNFGNMLDHDDAPARNVRVAAAPSAAHRSQAASHDDGMVSTVRNVIHRGLDYLFG